MLHRIVLLIENGGNESRWVQFFRKFDEGQRGQDQSVHPHTDHARYQQGARDTAGLDLHFEDFGLRCIRAHDRLLPKTLTVKLWIFQLSMTVESVYRLISEPAIPTIPIQYDPK